MPEQRTLGEIVDRFALREDHGEEGGPYLPLESVAPMSQGRVGQVRLFRGAPLFQVVTATIVVPPIGLDLHMLFAFTPSDSAVPHFTLDSVQAGGQLAFHLDLIPRLDLGAHLGYRLKGSGGGYFAMYNRNKRSLCVDLKHPESKRLVHGLTDQADVVINGGPSAGSFGTPVVDSAAVGRQGRIRGEARQPDAGLDLPCAGQYSREVAERSGCDAALIDDLIQRGVVREG